MASNLCLFALLGSLLGDGPLTPFRIPESQVSVWAIQLAPHASYYADSTSRMAGSLGVAPGWFFGIHGERLYLESDLAAPTVLDPPVLVLPDTGGPRPYDYRTEPALNIAADWYPSATPIGLRANPDLSFSLYSSRYVDALRLDRRFDGTAFVGAVFGRVRDATPVIAALRVAEVLRTEQQRKTDLTDREVQDLARLIARHWTFMAGHDRGGGDKYFYQAVEALLGTEAMGGLSARTWLRIRDEVERAGAAGTTLGYPERPVGVKLALTGGGRYYSRHVTEVTGSDTTTADETWNCPSVRIELNAGWPLSTRLHVSGNAAWQEDFPRSVLIRSVTSDLNIDYLVGEFFSVGLSDAPTFQITNPWTPEDHRRSLGNTLGIDVRYFVEDVVTVTLRTGVSSLVRWGPDAWDNGSSGVNFSLDLAYRLK